MSCAICDQNLCFPQRSKEASYQRLRQHHPLNVGWLEKKCPRDWMPSSQTRAQLSTTGHPLQAAEWCMSQLRIRSVFLAKARRPCFPPTSKLEPPTASHLPVSQITALPPLPQVSLPISHNSQFLSHTKHLIQCGLHYPTVIEFKVLVYS